MRFDELELSRIVRKGFSNMSLNDKINFNILNFIHCIHLNNQDFYRESFNSKLYGDLEMTFTKEADCLVGHCRVVINGENRVIDYLFTQNGYELLDDVIKG